MIPLNEVKPFLEGEALRKRMVELKRLVVEETQKAKALKTTQQKHL